ncbi:hypothetical protein GT037_003014 [Alternaria burnsii]|uniref:Uncharacterized protein n=1 Tax=Alternaria burnsii TaxID=1187904 RepID=A0A8H7B817_9PLEO|nr:uncharacterized protein GT037_003014 [Alternaria burnsii]KAF7679266.1 hypothetical protein GT037_003014 [Alternaria burnsii]CAI9631666.1 unnamed protein product [Alternaria burnsii]
MTASFVKILLLATASMATAVSVNASASVDASVNIDASANVDASANIDASADIDVDVDVSVGAVRIEDLAEQCDVPTNAMVNLLNTDDFATIKVEDWTAILQQPVGVVEAWPAPIKQIVFTDISVELSAMIAPETARRQLAPAVVTNKVEVTDAFESVRRVERQILASLDARIKSARSGCSQNTGCGTCVIAARLMGFGAIATCAGIDFAAIEANVDIDLPIVGAKVGIDVSVAISDLVACSSKATATVEAAIGVCHSNL